MAIWDRLTTAIASFGIGAATADAVTPELEPLRQTAWSNHPTRVVDPGSAARAAATAIETPVDLADDAARNGTGPARFALLTQLALHAPGIGELIRLRRRRAIDDAAFAHGLRKEAFEPRWDAALAKLLTELLDPAQLAAAIHRGLIPDPGLLKGEQPTGPFEVEAYPVYPIDALLEAEGSGYDHDRLGVLVGLQGLPMGPHEAAQALFRGVITHGDYIRAFNESNSRNEWAAAVLEQSRQIPTARDFLENALRGYSSLAEAIVGADLHGMSAEHATLIYQNQGRPMNVRQITQALSRGGVFQPEPGELTDPYDASIVEGSIKPAYYDLAKALRYTLPSPFAIRTLAASGVWSEAKTAQRLKDLGWLPADADEVAAAWASAPGATSKGETKAEFVDEYEAGFITRAQLQTGLEALGYSGRPLEAELHLADAKRVRKYRDAVVTKLHKLYTDHSIDEPTARADLAQVQISTEAIDELLPLWTLERDVTVKQLTAAQVKAAYKKGVYTVEAAVAELVERGYSATDAAAYLAT